MTGLTGLLKALRPRQWVKNLLVFLPLLFAVDLVWSADDLATLLPHLGRLLALVAAFCAAASAAYLLNDLADREADRQHPIKRRRPIASGEVPAWLALVGTLALASVSLVVMYFLGWPLVLAGSIYLAINVAYSAGLKRVALVDVMLVASGYVLRAVAGAVAVGAAPSPWLYAVTAAGALFLVVGRRYAEARLAGDESSEQRGTLQRYAPPLGGQLLTLAATAALVSYTLYTVEGENLPANNAMLLTVPLVIFGLFRYLYLLNNSQDAESPELLMMRDAPLLVSIVVWLAVSAAVLLLN